MIVSKHKPGIADDESRRIVLDWIDAKLTDVTHGITDAKPTQFRAGQEDILLEARLVLCGDMPTRPAA